MHHSSSHWFPQVRSSPLNLAKSHAVEWTWVTLFTPYSTGTFKSCSLHVHCCLTCVTAESWAVKSEPQVKPNALNTRTGSSGSLLTVPIFCAAWNTLPTVHPNTTILWESIEEVWWEVRKHLQKKGWYCSICKRFDRITQTLQGNNVVDL